MMMNLRSKLTALLLSGVMMTGLVACGGGAETTPAPDAGDASGDSAKTYVVGISQLVAHEALDAATKGFQDALEEALPGQVTFDYQNAANDPATCSTIANSFVSKGVDLIMANATPALQAAAAATSDIPVLGTSVTEYGVALQLNDFTGTVGTNVSGTSDLAPLDQQAEMLHTWFPDAKNVGLLYCSAEANSQYQVDTMKGHLEQMGYTCTFYSFTDSNDVQSVTQSATDGSDVIYVPTDNTVASNTGIIASIATVPIVAGEEGICKGCGVATLSISYYDLGVATGKMAAKILTGEADVSQMPIEYAATFTPKYNPTLCQAFGLTPPEGYQPIG